MKFSPLQLLRYLVTDISCRAIPNFDAAKPIEGAFEQYSVDVKVIRAEPTKEAPGHSWSAEMLISQQFVDGKNFPYEFRIALVGMFVFQDGVLQTEKEASFVRVNGSSMLYGIAREHIRALTAAGPWGAIIIPTMSFYENHEQPQKETVPPSAPETK